MEGTKKLLGCFGVGALCMMLLIGGSILFNKKESGSKVNHPTSSETSIAKEPTKTLEEVSDEIKNSVEAIYSEVLGNYKKGENYESRYLTREFYNYFVKAKELADKNGKVAIDHSLWHQAQDWNNMSAKVTNVEVTSPLATTAWAYVDLIDSLSNKVNRRSLTLYMAKENGEWKIDDMLADSHYGYEKTHLKEYINSVSPKQSVEETHQSTSFTISDAIGLYNSIFLANTNEYGINEYQLRIPNDLSARLSSFSVINGVEIERTETYMAIYYVDCSTSSNGYPKPTDKETAQWLGVNEDGEVILQVYSLTAKEALVRQLKVLAGFKRVNDNRYVSSDATVTIGNERGGYVFNIKETK